MKHQKGMGLISWVIVLALIAFVFTTALRLVPMHQEYYAVAQMMDSMEDEIRNNQMSRQQAMTMIQRRLNTGYINNVKPENIQISHGRDTPFVTRIVIDYEARTPFIAHIDFLGNFRKEIDVELSRR